MRLDDIIALRSLPGAGLILCLTERCPLSCAHCSTRSTLSGAVAEPGRLLRFVGDLGENPPAVVLLTGGEPFLHPEAVLAIAESLRDQGVASMALSGMFFARQARIPRLVERAIAALDHFSASIDAFHEREVPRDAVFDGLELFLDQGKDVSLHVVGSGPDDPYLLDVVADAEARFDGRVPVLANSVRPVGRVADWLSATPWAVDSDVAGPTPCRMAAWPTVSVDGTVTACCGQRTVDRRPVPRHLALGHIGSETWPEIRARSSGSPVLGMVRAFGPEYLARLFDPACTEDGGHCGSCHRLDRGKVIEEISVAARRPGLALVADMVQEARRLAGTAAFVGTGGSQ